MDYVGKTIEIVYMEGEPQYTGKRGVVKDQNYISMFGETHLRGTWGGCSIILGKDSFKVVED